MLFRAARWRLVFWNVTVMAAILAVLGGMVYAFFSSDVYSPVDKQLRFEDSLAIREVSLQGDLAAATSVAALGVYRVVVADPELRVDTSSDCPNSTVDIGVMPPCAASGLSPLSKDGMLQAAGHGGIDMRTVDFGNEPWRVLTQVVYLGSQPLGVIQIGRPVIGENNSLHELAFWLLLGALIGTVLTGIGSLFLAERALIPIRQAFNRQRQFTADASHELRTPLSLIRANAEMLARHAGTLPPQDSELISEIIQETDHLSRLVGDLLTLARADSGTLALQATPVDLRGLVESVHEDIRLIADAHGIQSDLNLDGPVTVRGDMGRLRQLLLILLDNAIKYTDVGGRVDVSLQRQDDHAHLVVADTGVGIPARDLPHIFERFYRVDQARGHENGGTGLGLAIARWIVQAHHGSIKVDSTPGKGTAFQIDLPLA